MCPRVGRMGLKSRDGLGQNNPIRSGAAKLVGVLAGESPARGTCPVATGPHVNRSVRIVGDAETLAPGRRPAFAAKELGRGSCGAPGVSDDDMSIKNSQRKHGTTRRSPRRRKLTHSEVTSYKPCR